MASKVRIACRRCRAKRIKCDGGIPACSNCQKADQVCLDVDGRNNAISIPRDFTATARARIQWLEDQLRRHAPHVNLDDGPKVDLWAVPEDAVPAPAVVHSPSAESGNMASLPKRTLTVAQAEDEGQLQEPFAAEARSVALDLGLLSLGSDSRQLHYLGSSSGRLFTSLIGMGSPETTAEGGVGATPSSLSQASPSGKPGPFAQAKRQKEASRLVYKILRKSLPSREDAQILLETYFRNIHAEHPFLHPQSIVDAVDALYQCADAEPSAEIGFNGWVTTVKPFAYNGEFALSRGLESTPISIFTATFHVLMAFTLAATVRTRQRMYDFAPDQFSRAATSVAHYAFSNTSVATLQAILLLAVHSLLSPTETNIWVLTYTAMAQCIDLGLHRMPADSDSITSAASLTRKLVFFTVYHLDRYVATIQGRPLGIRDEAFDVQLPSLQDVQADAASLTSLAYAPDYSIPAIVAFSLHRFKLDPIISEIKLLFYHLPSRISAYSWPTDHQETQKAIRKRLEDWRREIKSMSNALAQEITDEEHQLDMRQYELKVQSQFFAAMILLHQPSQVIPHPDEGSLLICYQCAASRINAYNSLYNSGGLFQSWRSVQGVFSSGATMIYSLWTSALVQKSVDLSSAMTDLRTCTNLLSVGGEWWPSVRKGKETFGRAMDALLKKLDHSKPSSTLRRNTRICDDQHARITAQFSSGEAQNFESFPLDASHYPENESIFQDADPTLPPGGNVPSRPENPTGYDAGDWVVSDTFGDQSLQFNPYGFDTTVSDMDTENLNNTVEAFITEFLQNDTAWNPF